MRNLGTHSAFEWTQTLVDAVQTGLGLIKKYTSQPRLPAAIRFSFSFPLPGVFGKQPPSSVLQLVLSLRLEK